MYAHLLEKPGGWVAPSAAAPLSPLADGLHGNASAATAARGPGKGAATGKNLKQALTKRGDRGGRQEVRRRRGRRRRVGRQLLARSTFVNPFIRTSGATHFRLLRREPLFPVTR